MTSPRLARRETRDDSHPAVARAEARAEAGAHARPDAATGRGGDARILREGRARRVWSWLQERAVGYNVQRALTPFPKLQKRVRQRSWTLKARRGMPLVDVEQLRPRLRAALAHLSRDGRTDIGDYLEFGVFAGTSLICMHRTLGEMGLDQVRLFGFDSFEGLPDEAAIDDGGLWHPGEFKAELEMVQARLARAGIADDRATLVKGWFSDTLRPDLASRLGIAKAGVIMLDADMYSSSKLALDFCAPLIRDDAVILLDDWYAMDGRLAARNLGQKRAFIEFLARDPGLRARDAGSYDVFGRLAGRVYHLRRVGRSPRRARRGPAAATA